MVTGRSNSGATLCAMRSSVIFALLALPFVTAQAPSALPTTQPAGLQWFKGNTHTHTLESDGDSTPDEVTRWYKEHGYNFLVLSDHNVLTQVDALNAKYAVPGVFTLIKGEEVTTPFEGKSIHVNGIDTRKPIGRQQGSSVPEILQRSVDAVRAQEGVPHINHPNFNWSITPSSSAR